MRIVLIAQAAFGKDTLETLIHQGETIVGVVTIPDHPNRPNPVRLSAENHHLPVLQPKRLKDPDVFQWVERRKPDLLVLAFVTEFVPQRMIDISTHGGINYHPSLLPKYRGGSAMNWAVIAGETETGVTIHFIDAGVDTGPILLQEAVEISPDDTIKSLYFKKLYPMGIRLLSEAVKQIRRGTAVSVPQDVATATHQPVITEADVVIDWTRSARTVYNMVRGANPSPGANTRFQGSLLKIWEAEPVLGDGEPGTVLEVTGEGVVVCTGGGGIRIRKIQYQDSGKIPATDLKGLASLKIGERIT